MVVLNMGKRKTNSRKKAQTSRENELKKEMLPPRSNGKVLSPKKIQQETKPLPRESNPSSEELQKFNNFQYWREPLPDIRNLRITDDAISNKVKRPSGQKIPADGKNSSFTEFSSFFYWKDPLPPLSPVEISCLLAR